MDGIFRRGMKITQSTRTALTVSTLWCVIIIIAAMLGLISERQLIEQTLVIGLIVIWLVKILLTWAKKIFDIDSF